MMKGSSIPATVCEELRGLDGRPDLESGYPANEPGAVHRPHMALITKRIFDLLAGTLLFIIFAPLMLVISAFIYLSFSGPVIYRQDRLGLGGREFCFYKFRTMVTGAQEVLDGYLDSNPQARSEWQLRLKLERDPRVTRWGQFLRSWSLDELPQLWNVIKGDISLVGPRPLLPGETAIYGVGYLDYCRVKPGLTGLWQVSGRNCMTFHERAQMDAWYIEHWSFGLDLRILLQTISAVLGRRGAY